MAKTSKSVPVDARIAAMTASPFLNTGGTCDKKSSGHCGEKLKSWHNFGEYSAGMIYAFLSSKNAPNAALPDKQLLASRRSALTLQTKPSTDLGSTTPPPAPARHKWSLLLFYSSHFLFTWNDRVWEFAAVILLIAAYPETLLPSSVFGLASTASAIIFSPSIGRWFDSTQRLKSVRWSIIVQRFVVSGGCVCLWAMITEIEQKSLKDGVFALVIMLGCFAKLAFVGKTVGIERDWAIVISQSEHVD